jgi:methionyl-tRNA formyltransferase
MYMDEGWDTGDTILQVETPLDPEETFGELSERLAKMGAQLLAETLDRIARKASPRIPQPGVGATFAPRLKPEDEILDFARGALEVHNCVRALSPAPGSYTHWRGIRVKVLRSAVVENEENYQPGEILRADRQHGLIVGTGSGSLELREVCPAGKNPMPAAAFINGYHPEPGDLLDQEDLGRE